jgi:aspartyl protease family protein
MEPSANSNSADAASSRRMGKGMMVIAWLIAMAMLTAFFQGREEAALNPNQQPLSSTAADGTREVTLQRNRQHHYVASGRINGHEVRFLLDTGASDVVVPQQLAQRIGLVAGAPAQAQTANGVVRIYRTRIEQLEIGDIVLRDVRASINTGEQSGAVLLGMSALKDIEFIQRGDSLTLRL